MSLEEGSAECMVGGCMCACVCVFATVPPPWESCLAESLWSVQTHTDVST